MMAEQRGHNHVPAFSTVGLFSQEFASCVRYSMSNRVVLYITFTKHTDRACIHWINQNVSPGWKTKTLTEYPNDIYTYIFFLAFGWLWFICLCLKKTGRHFGKYTKRRKQISIFHKIWNYSIKKDSASKLMFFICSFFWSDRGKHFFSFSQRQSIVTVTIGTRFLISWALNWKLMQFEVPSTFAWAWTNGGKKNYKRKGHLQNSCGELTSQKSQSVSGITCFPFLSVILNEHTGGGAQRKHWFLCNLFIFSQTDKVVRWQLLWYF